MSIFEYDEERELELFRAAERENGREEGLQEGRKEGLIQGLITTCKELGVSFEATMEKLKEKYSMKDEEAQKNMKLYWQDKL